jgi:hypothetical protein
VNAVRADPELRVRYQFWVFYYPTANPPALSALAFRKDLATAERLYHPKHGIVLVGHSMGGLVSRMQAVDTGRVLWDECFHQNADALYARIPADNLLKQTLVFHADPDVKRIIFECVPHRGSFSRRRHGWRTRRQLDSCSSKRDFDNQNHAWRLPGEGYGRERPTSSHQHFGAFAPLADPDRVG